MDFAPDAERRLFADTLERFLRERYPFVRRRENAGRPEGFAPEDWRAFAELGLVGALLPRAAGGFGGTGEDLILAFGRLGRALVVEPLLAGAVLGAWPLACAGETELVAAVVAGERLVSLAHEEAPGAGATRAVRTGDGRWRLDGRKTRVPFGAQADALVVSAAPGAAGGETGLFLVAADAPGLRRADRRTPDDRRLAEVELHEAPARRLEHPALTGAAVLARTLERGALALAAEAVGLMDHCHATTLDYLKTRRQFGRTLGSFQALQHRMVDLVIDIELCRSAVLLAAATLDAGHPDAEMNLSAAKHLAGRTGRRVAEECIQMHGAIAMTDDYPMAHYAKRLVLVDDQLGDADTHLRRFVRLHSAAGAST